ncbi:MAG: alpha/beta fold hydrolase [Patescibacteria group bacterium]
MNKVFLIHGFEGSPNGGWRPWLMTKLNEHEAWACSLSMPSPEKPILKEWLDEIKLHVERNQNDNIYLVGHSLGGTVILRYLEIYDDKNIKGIILVSTPCEKTQNRKIDNFLETDFDYNLIKSRVKNITVIHGADDPWVSPENAKHIAEKTNGKLILIPNGKHLNDSSGFRELPECLDVLLEMMK